MLFKDYPINPVAVIQRANDLIQVMGSEPLSLYDQKLNALVISLCEEFNTVYAEQQKKFGDLIKLHGETIKALTR